MSLDSKSIPLGTGDEIIHRPRRFQQDTAIQFNSGTADEYEFFRRTGSLVGESKPGHIKIRREPRSFDVSLFRRSPLLSQE